MFKTTKAKILLVLVFSIICISATAILILYNDIEIEENNQEIIEQTSESIKEKDVQGINLKGTYNQNDLKIEEKALTQEKIEIRYFQISGLKNKYIENKINKDIENNALNCYKDQIKDLNEVININVNMWNSANFANTISFELNYSAKIDDYSDDFYQGIRTLNYDLNTGEKITIDEMFTSDAPIENILRQSAYYNFISSKTEDNLAGDLVILDYGDIEEEISNITNLYKKGKLTQFTYTPMNINLYYNDNQSISISMKNFAEFIAIYTRYLSKESLFENENIGMKNLYTITNRYDNIYYYTNYQNEENYFIDISIDYQSTEDDKFAQKIIQDKIVEIEKEIENIKQKVKENSNKFYILNYYISVYTGETWDTKQVFTNCNERGNAYEMTVHDFEENIEPIIIECNRQDESGGIPDYIYDFSELLKIEPQSTNENYNPETGEKIVL